MPVIGIAIKTIDAKKHKDITGGQLKVNNNTNLLEVKEQDLPGLDKKGLGIDFLFRTTYRLSDEKTPVAEIIIGGTTFYVDAKQKKIVDEWKKNKTLGDEVNLQVINAILRKCITKSLNLSEELQLPPPIGLPFASKKKGSPEDSRYIG